MSELNSGAVNKPNAISGALQQTLSVKLKQKGRSHVPTVCSIGPISCYVNDGDNWHKTDFSPDQYKISLSQLFSGGQKTLGAPTNNIDAMKYDHFWFLFSQEESDGLTFNHFRPHNDVLVQNSTSLMKLGRRKALITTRRPEDIETEELKPGLPGVGEYGIECDRGEFRYPVSKTLIFGSNPICDIKVEGVKPFVAMIFVHKNDLFVANLGFDELLVNEEPVRDSFKSLALNDVIAINEVAITIKLPEAPFDALGEQFPDNTLCLLDINSTERSIHKMFLPISKALTFGRGSVSDIVIDDKSISRKHAQLIIYEDHVLVLDCYSKNGTFVNDNKIGKSRARPGDLVTFANKSYLLCHYFG